jgi:hypothetical protein
LIGVTAYRYPSPSLVKLDSRDRGHRSGRLRRPGFAFGPAVERVSETARTPERSLLMYIGLGTLILIILIVLLVA